MIYFYRFAEILFFIPVSLLKKIKTFFIFKEYYLKIDGYFFCKKSNSFFIVLKVKNKRSIENVTFNEILNCQEYLEEINPIDLFLISMIYNLKNNGFFEKLDTGFKKIRNSGCNFKSKPFLRVIKKYTDENRKTIIHIESKHTKKEISFNIEDLIKRKSIIYGLDGRDALSLGYDASEALIRNAM